MELVFNTLTVETQPLIDKYLSDTLDASCDYCLASIFLFTEMKNLQFAQDDIALYMKGLYHDEDIFFSPLCKDENFIEAISRLKEYAHLNNIVLRFYATRKHVFSLLLSEDYTDSQAEELLKNQSFVTKNFCYENDRDSAEYIYKPEKLINLSGSVYKSKRNEIHRFIEKYSGRYNIRKYTDEDIDGVLSLVDDWSKAKEFSHNEEPEKLKFILEHRKELKVDAVVLEVDGKIVASSLYSITSSNTGDEIFERCRPEYKNAYALIARFVATCLSNCTYINFEEDLGLEGLRFSKLSYNPDFLIEKFIVCENLENELKEIYQTIFGDGDKFTNEIFSEHSQCSRTALVLNSEKVISCAFFRDKKLRAFNNTVKYPFIFGLGTNEKFRNQGLAKRTMVQMLNMISDQGYGFCGLFPFPVSRTFYEKMGFINFNYSKRKKLKDVLVNGTKISINNYPDAQEYTNFFNKCYENIPLSQIRDVADTQKLFDEVKAYEGKFIEFKYRGYLYGYIIKSEEEVEESIFDMDFLHKHKKHYSTKKNDKFSYILNEEISLFMGGRYLTEGKNYSPYDMIRPVNPYLFIKTFLPLIETNKNLKTNIFIEDNMVSNSMVFLNIEKKKASIHSYAEQNLPIVKITVNQLAKWIFGLEEISGLPKIRKKNIKTMFSDGY